SQLVHEDLAVFVRVVKELLATQSFTDCLFGVLWCAMKIGRHGEHCSRIVGGLDEPGYEEHLDGRDPDGVLLADSFLVLSPSVAASQLPPRCLTRQPDLTQIFIQVCTNLRRGVGGV